MASPGARRIVQGDYLIGPLDSPGPAPDGDLVAPQDGSKLSASDVRQILDRAIATANQTRAVIRLPIGSRTRMVIAVTDVDGTVLGLHRMPDATFFSIDVAVAKARNMVYFSGAGALRIYPGFPTARPSPIGRSASERSRSFRRASTAPDHGPFFDLYVKDTINPCTQGSQPANPNQNGIVFFPGALPSLQERCSGGRPRRQRRRRGAGRLRDVRRRGGFRSACECSRRPRVHRRRADAVPEVPAQPDKVITEEPLTPRVPRTPHRIPPRPAARIPPLGRPYAPDRSETGTIFRRRRLVRRA